jgi:phage terminase large subunit-like protein
LYQYGQKVARGEIIDPAFFMAWWEANPDANHRDREAWMEANPGFGDIVSEEDFESAIRRTPEAEFRTKRLNQWVSSQISWLPNGTWEPLADEVAWDDEEIMLGFDGSFSGDATAIVGCTVPKDPDTKPHVFMVKAWEKRDGIDDENWRVPIQEVEQTIIDFCASHKVREVACDPYRWQRSMEVLQDQGIPIVEYPSTSAKRMVTSCAKFFDYVTDGRMSHDGNPMLTRHLSNAVTKSDALGVRIVKENRNSSRRIDCAVAAILALDRATSGRLETQVIPEFFSF